MMIKALIHTVFEHQATQSANQIAVVDAQTQITYAALNGKANQLARTLLSVGEGKVTGVMVPASTDLVTALLASFKAAHIYLPLEVTHAPKRIAHILKESKAQTLIVAEEYLVFAKDLILTEQIAIETLLVMSDSIDLGTDFEQGVESLIEIAQREPWVEVLTAAGQFERSATDPSAFDNHNLDLEIAKDAASYIFYTSGSTGQPKGIVGSHKSLSQYIHYHIEEWEIGPGTRMAQLASPAFDASLKDILSALCAGASLHIPEAATKSNMVQLLAWLQAQQITQIQTVPSLFRLITKAMREGEQRLEHLEYIVLAGEKLYGQDVLNWQTTNDGKGRISNLYGLTETTILKTCYHISQSSWSPAEVIPVGQAIPKAVIAVIDGDQLCDTGEIGEVYIKSPFLTKGYLDEESNAQVFVQNPLNVQKEDIIFKTGDLGRFDKEGNLQILGRKDDQLKLNGVRVEPAEIRGAILSLVPVEELELVVHTNDLYEQRLISYYTGSVLSAAQFREQLQPVLNPQFIPSYFIHLQEFPLNLNGKVDRKALPKPEELLRSGQYEAPTTEAEHKLAKLWEQVLGEVKVGRKDSFFNIGGSSLKAIQLISRIYKEYEVQLTIADIFDQPVLQDQALLLGQTATEDSAAQTSLQPLAKQAHYALSYAQRRLWVLDQLHSNFAAYNRPISYRIEGPLEVEILHQAFDRLTGRHESLRTIFKTVEGEPRQFIQDPKAIAGAFSYQDISQESEPKAMVASAMQQQSETAMDLQKGPLFRGILYRLGKNHHELILVIHHIISDDWSLDLILTQLTADYQLLLAGKAPEVRPPALQYKEFAAWQHEQVKEQTASRDFWHQNLQGDLPVLNLPTDFPRPAVQTFGGKRIELRIAGEAHHQLHQLLQQQGATLFMGVSAIINTLLYRYTGQTDMIIGAPVAGRNHPDLEDQIGIFINLLALRTHFGAEDSFLSLLAKVKHTVLEAYKHQQYPFDLMVDELNLSRDLSRNPLFDVALVDNGAGQGQHIEISGLSITANPAEVDTSLYDLTFWSEDRPEELIINLEYNTALFTEARIKAMVQHLEAIIAHVGTAPETSLNAVNLLSQEERATLQTGLQTGFTNFPKGTISELLREQAVKSPGHVALTSSDAMLTYEQLEQRANQMSHYLIDTYGVTPGAVVGLMLGRNVDLVVAILALFKAGAAYLPIDLETPAARLHYLIEDSGTKLIIASKSIEHSAVRSFVPAEAHEVLKEQSNDCPKVKTSQEELAYLIYTSGSTGQPKGVLVEHKSVVNLLDAMRKELHFQAGEKLLALTTHAFDISVLELFLPLLSGGCLLLPNEDMLQNKDKLADVIRRAKPDVIQATPGMWTLLADSDLAPVEGFRVLSGGEALPLSLAQKLAKIGKLYNVYGPTETTIWSTCHQAAPDEDPTLIGVPLQNTEVFILDEQLQLVPRGVPGTLYIGGEGLTRGYHQRAELTASRFIDHPFRPKAKIYDTGDLAALTFDGKLKYLGRQDDQIKLRGYRIELGEITNQIERVQGVNRATVTVHGDILIAYYEATEALVEEQIKSHMAAFLPGYMMPTRYIYLSKLPLNANGKVDKKALPAPAEHEAVTYIAPRDLTERKLVTLIQTLLGISKISMSDNFFRIGGHSLNGIQLISRIFEAFGTQLSLKDLFENGQIDDLAACIKETQTAGYSAITAQPEQESYPLSFAQHSLWVLEQFEEEGSTAYNLPISYRLLGKLNVKAIANAITTVISRHESLRTVIGRQNGKPVQQIIDADLSAEQVTITDLREQEEAVLLAKQLLHDVAFTPFDLAKGPLLRCHIIQVSQEESFISLTAHHIIADEWSVRLLLQEIVQLYNAALQGKVAQLRPLQIQYKDYANWYSIQLEEENIKPHRSYWLDKLSGDLPVINLPSDRPRTALRSFKTAQLAMPLGQELSQKWRVYVKEEETTPFIALVALVNALLYRYTGQNDLIIGVPSAGRFHPDLHDQIGLFVNGLVVRTQLDKSQGFSELLRSVRKSMLDAYSHEVYPFNKLVSDLNLKQDLSRAPLFDVMVAMENADVQDTGLRMQGLVAEEYKLQVPLSKIDLRFFFINDEDQLRLQLEYSTDLYDEERISRMGEHFICLMEDILANTATPINTKNYLTTQERLLVTEVNSVCDTALVDQTLVELFEEQADLSAALPAVLGTATLTYQDLHEQANKIAHYLRQQYAVVPEEVVAVMVGRNNWIPVAVLAVLKSGAAYLPIDPGLPAERISFMLRDAGVKVLVTESEYLFNLEGYEGAIYGIDIETEYLETPVTNPKLVNQPADLAYIIYTSGSTGKPKGVMIEHGQAVTMVRNEWAIFKPEPKDRVLQFSSVSFDASLAQLFLALSSGAGLVMINQAQIQDQDKFIAYCREQQVSIVIVPATFMANLDVSQLDFMRLIITAGDVAHVDTAVACSQFARYLNCYGPTEATIWSSYYPVTPADQGKQRIPIGRPISHTQLYIVNDNLQLQGVGVPGEICIAGKQVARGYLNQPELTAEKFIANPFGRDRLYRTGDLGSLLPDGSIDFLGRKDDQVKIRGFRVELGEIEETLHTVRGVDQAVVIAREIQGQLTLVAYYLSTALTEPATLKKALQRQLPEYMIPAYIVLMEQFPVSTSGKVNRKALPDPLAQRVEEIVLPHTEQEEALYTIWKQVLQLDKLSTTDHFFEVGGHSLRATEVISRIQKELGISLELKDIFEHPVLADLAKLMEGSEKAGISAIGILPEASHYELSHAQRRMWVLEQFEEEGSNTYNIPLTYWLHGEVSTTVFEQAFQSLIARHEILRTVIRVIEGEPRQQVLAPDTYTPLVSYLDLSKQPNAEAYALQKANERAFLPFDLAQGPLLRVELYEVAPGKLLFMLCMHHIISDEWSLHVLLQELVALYNAALNNTPLTLQPLPIQYKDYAAWQMEELRNERLTIHRDFWHEQLAGELPVLNLPTDAPRPRVQTFRGGHHYFRFNKEQSEQFRSMLLQKEASLFMGLVAIVKTLLFRYSGQSDLIVGSPAAGRNHPDTENQIGFYLNNLVLRDQIKAETGFSSLLEQVKQTTLAAFSHQVYPFDYLVDELDLGRDMSRSPIFDVAVVLEDSRKLVSLPGLSGATIEDALLDIPVSKLDLRFFFVDNDDCIGLTLEYNADLFAPARIERMASHLGGILEAVTEQPQKALNEISYLSANELEQVLFDFNDFRTEVPNGQTFVSLFEERVVQNPEATALAEGAQKVSYGELNRRANQLAYHLREALGAKREDRVALMADRGVNVLVAFLGILKAGAAYMPIDPSFPKDRIRYMLEDGAAGILLTESGYLFDFDYYEGTLFALDLELEMLETPRGNPTPVNQETDLAYVIYTSGSTGKPKGVMVTHSNTVNLAYHKRDRFAVTPADVVMQFAPLAFDGSVFEFIVALGNGASLLLAPAKLIMDSRLLMEYMEAHQATLVIFPSAYIASIDRSKTGFLRVIATAGDIANVAYTTEIAQHTTIYNGYGPTENTVVTSIYQVKPEDASLRRLPIGQPINNGQLYIVDAQLQPMPIGVPGELCIAGAGLSKGYLNRPELNEAKFIDNPFGPGKLYRSGDLACWLPNGQVDFMGRIDEQVKIRGFRIELEEVEKAIQQVEGVREVVVTVVGEGADKQLAAYFVSQEGTTESIIKRALQAELPEFMIPGHFIALTTLPVNSSGKVDKKALPKPDQVVREEVVEVKTETETMLHGVWTEILGREGISKEDNFFETGGHSLKAIQMLTRIYQNHGVQLTISDVFANPVLQDLAVLIDKSAGSGFESIPLADRAEDYPLSRAQRRMWVQETQAKDALTYNIFADFRLTGELDITALERAFALLIDRHESLRTVFRIKEGEPRQYIRESAEVGFPLRVEDLSQMADQDQRIVEAVTAFARSPFELSEGPLLRVQLLKISDLEHLLLYATHHIVSDEWSTQVLVKEVMTAYNAYRSGDEPVFSPLRIQYKDFAVWEEATLHAERLGELQDYWHTQLAGELPVLELPTDHTRPAQQTFEGKNTAFRFSDELSQQLRDYTQQTGTTLFMGLTAIVKTLLYRYTGQQDLIIGTPVAGREHPELEEQIGYYLNTLALRTELDKEAGFETLLQKVKTTALEAFSHQQYPLDQLIETLNPPVAPGHSPLFDVVIILQNVDLSPAASVNMDGLEIEALDDELHIAKSDLRFQFTDRGDYIDGVIEYNTQLFEQERVEQMISHLLKLSEVMLREPSLSLKNVEYLSEEERAAGAWFAQPQEEEEQPLVTDLFDTCVAEFPNLIALEYKNEHISYQQLSKQVNRVAQALLAAGVKKGDHVAVLLDSSPEWATALLSVLKVGAIYLPVSGQLATRRLEQMTTETSPVLLVSHAQQLRQAPHVQAVLGDVPCLELRAELHLDGIALNDLSEETPQVELSAQDAAYVFYTSGSTGSGKGITGKHNSLSHYILWHRKEYGVNESSNLCQIAPVTFDASLKDVLVALTSGATLCIPEQEVKDNTALLVEWTREQSITLLQTVPSRFRLLSKALEEAGVTLPALQHIVLAGEKLYGQDLLNWKRVNGTQANISNMYGLTESTILKTCYHVPHWDWEPAQMVPVGQAIPGTLVATLSDGNICQYGEIGEVYIKSPYTTYGYTETILNEGLFVQNPLVTGRVDLLVKTGDLGRVNNDGQLEILGRIDDQVKVNGVRIEPEEVRAALLSLPEVDEVELILHQDQDYQQELIAYYTGTAAAIETLREQLAVLLNKQYLPAYLMHLEEFPLNLNGKVDRKALPKPEELRRSKHYEAPIDELEQNLAAIWALILGAEEAGRHDNFFDQGGSSLKAIQLISRIYKELDVQLTIGDVFAAPTLTQQAAKIREARQSNFVAIPKATRAARYPLSHSQQRLFVQEEQSEGSVTYNIFMSYQMRGDLKLPILRAAFDQLLERHESLRTRFMLQDGQPYQQVCDLADYGFALAYEDLRGLAAQHDQIKQHTDALAFGTFDLKKGPLLRVSVLQLENDAYISLFAIHHIISDEWSQQILVHDLLAIYNALVQKQAVQLPTLPIQYKDYAVWQQEQLHGEALAAHKAYWLQKMKGEIPVLKLQTDRARPQKLTFNGEELSFELDTALSKQLLGMAKAEQVTLFMLLVAGVKTLLYRYTGQQDIILGTPVAGRAHADLEHQIGYFLNTLALRDQVEGSKSYRHLLQQVKATALEAFEHQVYPFDTLIEDLALEPDQSRSPLFDVAIILQNVAIHTEQELHMEGVEVEPVGEDLKISKSDLRFQFAEMGDQIAGTIEYNTDLFDESRIQKMIAHMHHLFEAMMAEPDAALNTLHYLTKEEREQEEAESTSFGSAISTDF